MIFQYQDNEVMQALKQLQVNALQECCENIINKLSGDLEQICVDTKEWFAKWLEERQFRITGSICYNVYTYTKNKNPDWKKKCKDTFTPKAFKTEYTEYGKKTEEEARNAFRESTNKTVIEIGLVVSRLNPWLAYSPDGVILKDQKPVALLEIKCPFKGKTRNITDTVDSQLNKCLIIKGENILLKEKHRYYGQIQLGMVVLNLNLTYFVIYSAFDKKLHTIRVSRNDIFITKMLTALKKVYYNIMLHEICLMKDSGESCEKHASDTV